MKFVTYFLVLVLCCAVWGHPTQNVRFIKTVNNVVHSFTNKTDQLGFFFKARSRFGYFFVAFSPSNVTLVNAFSLLMLVDYTSGHAGYRNITYWSLKGVDGMNFYENASLASAVPWYVLDHYKTDLNYFPIGRYIDDISYTVNLPRSKYGWITEDHYIYTAFSYDDNPLDPTKIHQPDESTLLKVSDLNSIDNLYYAPTLRLEQMHLSPFIIELSILPLLMGLCILLYILNVQPIRSRGITPMLACVGHFLHLFSGITQFIYTLEDFKYNCIWLYFMQQAVLLTLLFLSLFHFFRYILIVNLNRAKFFYVQKSAMGTGSTDVSIAQQWKFRILKILGSSWLLFALVIVVYLVYALAHLIGFSATNFVCNNEVYWYSIFYVVSISLVMGGFLILFVYDAILNFGKVLSCRLLDFWREDVFWYRLEVYGIGLFIVFPFWLISEFVNPDRYQIKTYRFERNQIRPEIPVVSTLDSMAFYTFFFMQCGFVLCLTLWKLFLKLFRKEKPKTELITYLETPEKRVLFESFCSREWAGENIACYMDIVRYEKLSNYNDRLVAATTILAIYLNGLASPLEINVSKKCVSDYHAAINTGKIDDHLFDQIKLALVHNMSDNFARFTNTSEYYTMLAKDRLIG